MLADIIVLYIRPQSIYDNLVLLIFLCVFVKSAQQIGLGINALLHGVSTVQMIDQNLCLSND